MHERKPAHCQKGPSKFCVLCRRFYCQIHRATKGPEADADVCEINHTTYYRNHRHSEEGIFPTLESEQTAADAESEIDYQRLEGLEVTILIDD